MFAHYILILWTALGNWVTADANRELTAWAIYYGVSPAVVYAVARIETGNVPEARRDTVVSKTGDVGRLQINKSMWCPRLGMKGVECEQWLQNRSNNYSTGAAILARVQRKYSNGSLTSCRCNGTHTGGWIAHYNGGVVVKEGSRAERYGNRAIKYTREATGGALRY